MASNPSIGKFHLSTLLGSDTIFRLLVESVEDYAVFVLDPDGYIATWNLGAQHIKGYQADEIIGKHFSIFYPQKDKDAGKPQMELRIAGEVGRFEDEGWRIRKDGTRFWANVLITRLMDSEGHILGYGKITRDLTERRLADMRYKLLVEGVQDYAIYSLDPTGVITSWNVGAQRIKGYTADEIIGQHFSRFYTEEDRRNGVPAKVLERARAENHYEGEGWRVRKDGTRFWSSVVVTPLLDEEGNLTGFSKVTRDVTDRKELLDQVRAHAAELELRVAEREAANTELEAFSYSVSHDLRAPLRAIDGFAQALSEDHSAELDETGKDYLREIQSAARRMNTLVQDLLNYSRLGRVELGFTSISVKRVVEAVTEDLGDARGFLNAKIDPKLFVLSHDATLRQVLTNLIANALKFRREGVGPEVKVTAVAKDGFARISVADNGIGIAPQHQERIFKVFERLHSTDSYPGTGIGLAIVQRAVLRMGGRIGVDSIPGEGSTFWIELPMAGGQ